MIKREFYERVAAILNAPHDYNSYNDVIFRYDKETGIKCGTNSSRFVGRQPGTGRFPGIGTVRHYGSAIHISLNNPRVQKICASEEEAISFLTELFSR